MTPLRLELSNFMGHRATSVDYAGARLSVFVGENGAGKSAASSEALEYALFGRARAASADDLVTWGESDMSVELTFDHAGDLYRVGRGRTLRSGGKSWLELHLWDPATPEAARPLTGATIAETQAMLERILGMDHATFRSAVLLKQADMARFARATAGERKRILGQVLGLELWERAEQIARDRARDAEAGLSAARDELARLEARLSDRPAAALALEEARAAVASLEDHAAGMAEGRASREARLRELAGEEASAAAAVDEARRLEDEVAELQRRYRATASRRDLSVASLAELGARPPAAMPATAEEAREAEARAQRALAEAERAFDTENEAYRAEAAALEGRRAGLVHTEAELSAAVAGLGLVTCPGCGKAFPADPAGLAGRLKVARSELLKLPEPSEPYRIGRARGQLARRQSDQREAEAALHERVRLDAEADLASVEARGRLARESLEKARSRASSARRLAEERTRVELELRTVVSAIAAREAEVREAHAAAGRAEQALAALEDAASRIPAAREAEAGAGARAGRLRRLVAAFGADGIPARVVESVLPELSAEAGLVLADTLPGWGVELRAQRARKGGGMAEALDVVVLRDGTPRPFEALSGGQETIFVLALALALSRLASRRSGSPVRFVALDEPAWLDRNNSRVFGQALRQLAHRGDLEMVSLVTHNEELAEYADRVHRVTVSPSGSTIAPA